MYKMKTNKSVKSRFKVTGSGKLKRNKQGRRHILEKKSSARKRHLRRPTLVSEGQEKTYKRMMGIA